MLIMHFILQQFGELFLTFIAFSFDLDAVNKDGLFKEFTIYLLFT